ncbi:ABC transporter substrate-binding protein [Paenibacillus sp. NPDC056579]|uniref:ABC transporter substrate-binding protein n=1 Tax=Paenibacillus sp. NPDC056579 TaxID=3345871 RepID=UPI00368FF120
MTKLRNHIAVFTVLTMLALLLASCGANSNSAGSQHSTESVSTGSADPSKQTEPATRTFKDAKNRSVVIPQQPQRIIAHYFPAEAVALGIKPIGTNLVTARQILSEDQLKGIEDIGGQGTEPNLEKVLALNPDLILVPDFLGEASIEALSKIAPTVAVSYTIDVFSRLQLLGDITGKAKEAEAWINSYRSKAQEKREQLKSYVKPGETATALNYFQDKKLYVYGNQRLGATMYDALGFQRTEKAKLLFADNPNALWQSISAEVLPEVVGDTIFIVVNDANPDIKSGVEELLQSPLWKNLPAVKNGRAYIVGNKWSFYDPITLDWLLDEMPKKLMTKSSN